ncbi:MurR/RpiR family transcriptional regulator [Alkalicoccus chagannorensis]|uniref:MurR/RpiR family transcriptional regulator n=1 Tax=Alkalicoccus chagannorensis TaxID=427072 RepID=UPI000429D4AC|nr:MurR/RpiR family transcriptional regulator [Alkalicoccus chagannorensis]
MFDPDHMKQFSEVDTAIYTFVIHHKEQAAYMRVRELAEAAHVSPASVHRFCIKNGYSGFSEWKAALKQTLKTEPAATTSMHDVMEEFLERTLRGDDAARIEQAAASIREADFVLCAGTGGSGIMAEYGARYFASMGCFAASINDPFYPIHGAYGRKTTAVVLSVSGETSMTLEQTRQLQENGAYIISITNHRSCTLAGIADLPLTYFMDQQFAGHSNVTTQLPVVYLLELLGREASRR